MEDKSLESFICYCDNMTIVEEGTFGVAIKNVIDKLLHLIETIRNKIKEIVSSLKREETFKAPDQVMRDYNNLIRDFDRISVNELTDNTENRIDAIILDVDKLRELIASTSDSKPHLNVFKTNSIEWDLNMLEDAIQYAENDINNLRKELYKYHDKIYTEHNTDLKNMMNDSSNDLKEKIRLISKYVNCCNKLVALGNKIITAY